jgi:hypothetical protein
MPPVKSTQQTGQDVGPDGSIGGNPQWFTDRHYASASLCHSPPSCVGSRDHLLGMSVQFASLVGESEVFAPLLQQGQLRRSFQLCHQG